MYIDLTHTFTATMPVFPGDPASELRTIASLEQDGSTGSEIRASVHVGTHLDAPSHFFGHGKDVADFLPDAFFGNGTIIDARSGLDSMVELPAAVHSQIKKNDIVLVCTGWDTKFRFPDYYENFPCLSYPLAEKLVARGVKMVGFDTPSPDRPPYEIHKLFLSHGIVILENLANVQSLLPYKKFEIVALPLKLEAEGAPVRVVAHV